MTKHPLCEEGWHQFRLHCKCCQMLRGVDAAGAQKVFHEHTERRREPADAESPAASYVPQPVPRTHDDYLPQEVDLLRDVMVGMAGMAFDTGATSADASISTDTATTDFSGGGGDFGGAGASGSWDSGGSFDGGSGDTGGTGDTNS